MPQPVRPATRGATVTATLTWADTDLTAEVVDAGGDRTSAGLPSGGYGLAGLAERAALAGGRLDAGPATDGWRVALTMPVPGPNPGPGPEPAAGSAAPHPQEFRA